MSVSGSTRDRIAPRDGRGKEDPPVWVGRWLDARYRIDRLIAEGTTGHIYEAVQMPLERRVAVKVLPREQAERSDLFQRRFRREAAIAARLNHPHIVTVIEYGETKTQDSFMVMEFLEGRPLTDVLREEGRLPIPRALRIATQVARALRRAHASGVVHRDLKPANITVMADDDGMDHVKVFDFGLVKVFSPDQARPAVPEAAVESLTRAGSVMGTPGYMAPEQILGGQVDGRADFYALGVTMTQMLTGRMPFGGTSMSGVLRAQLHGRARSIRELEPGLDCSDALEIMIGRCLERDAKARYADVEALCAALKRVWKIETDSNLDTDPSLRKRDPAATVVVRTPPSTPPSTPRRSRNRRRKALRGARGRRRVRPWWAVVLIAAGLAGLGVGLGWWVTEPGGLLAVWAASLPEVVDAKSARPYKDNPY